MGRQVIGDLLVLPGGGSRDDLGELGVGRVLQNKALARGGGAELRPASGSGLKGGVGQGACGTAARLGVDRTWQDVADLGAGPRQIVA